MIRTAAVGVAAFITLLCLGPVSLSPLEVIAALMGSGSTRAVQVVWELRLPVAIVTAIVGAALSLAGFWTQAAARNPLASPDILGVSGGAAVAVVAFPVSSFWERACIALAGSVICLVILLSLGARRSIRQLILIGVALAILSQSIVSYLLLRADLMRATQAQVWLTGSTSFARWAVVPPLVVGVVAFAICGFTQHRDVTLLAHDDVTASSLGADLNRVRLVLVIAATGIVAVAVSMVGPIAFIALVAPQLARLMGGGAVHASLAGASLLLVCAVVAVALPISVPVGLITSVLGGVVLVILVTARRRV